MDTPTVPLLKRCCRCGNELPATPENFQRDKGVRDGLSRACKTCLNTAERVKTAKHRALRPKYTREQLEAKQERIRRYEEEHSGRLQPTKASSEGYKRCIRCSSEYPLSDEYWYRQTKSGNFQGACKDCTKAGARRWQEQHPDYMHDYAQAYNMLGSEAVKQATRERREATKEEKRLHKEARKREIEKARLRRDEAFAQADQHLNDGPTKRCTKCLKEFPATTEYFHKAGRSRLNTRCKLCQYAVIRLSGKRHPDTVKVKNRNRRALEYAAEGTHSVEDERRQLRAQKNRCWWCSARIKGGNYHVDHVVPLIRGGSNGPENIVIACPTCNESKGAKTPAEFMGRLF